MTEIGFGKAEEECDAAMLTGSGMDQLSHECIEPKGHKGPHICCACSEQF